MTADRCSRCDRPARSIVSYTTKAGRIVERTCGGCGRQLKRKYGRAIRVVSIDARFVDR